MWNVIYQCILTGSRIFFRMTGMVLIFVAKCFWERIVFLILQGGGLNLVLSGSIELVS